MANISEILARAAALRDETALNSIDPERCGGIMYDTLIALNELWLQQGSALVISKIYSSVSAMQADTAPVSDLTGRPLRPGQIVVIASSDSDNGSVYRYNGTSSPSWSEVGVIGSVVPVDNLESDSTALPLAAHQGKVLDGKISQLGQNVHLFSPLMYLNFIGTGNDFASGNKCYNIIKGHKYRVYVDTDVDMSGVTSGGYRLEIRLYTQSDTLVRTLVYVNVGTALQPYYDFEIGENETYAYMSFGGRCAQGVEFRGYFEDTTFSAPRSSIEEIGQTFQKIEENFVKAANYIPGYHFNTQGETVADPDGIIGKDLIPIAPRTVILWKSGVENTQYTLVCYGSDGTTVVDYWRSYNATDNECALSQTTYYIKGSFKKDDNGYIKKKADGTILFEQKYGCESLQEQCNSLQEQIDEINSDLHPDDIVSELNVDMIPAIQAAGARPEAEYYADVQTVYKNIGLLPVLGIITDAHVMSTTLTPIIERSFAFADKHNAIVGTLALGDIADNGSILKAINWETLESKFTKPILFIPGNHESYMGWNYNPPMNATESDLMNKWYTDALILRNGETHAEISSVKKSYWYRDFSVTDAKDNVTRTLRVIGLNCYTKPTGAPLGFSPDELNWLITTLENCGSNTNVVIINHEAISTQLKENRYTDVFNMQPYSRYSAASRSHNVIAEIVNAWKHRLQLNITYNDNTFTHNFSNANGNFVCYITGHEHVDGVYKHQTYQDQIEISLICTSQNENQQMCDLPRQIGTRTEDCFTLFSYDWYNQRINLVRIGSNVTTAMKNRKYDNFPLITE